MRYVPIAALALAGLACAAPASAAPAGPGPGPGAVRQDVGAPDSGLVQKAHSARWYRSYRIFGPPAAWRARHWGGPGYGYGPRPGYGPGPGYGYGRPYGYGPRYGGW